MGVSTDPQLSFGVDLSEIDDLPSFLSDENSFGDWISELTGVEDWSDRDEYLKNYPVNVLDTCSFEYVVPILYIPGYHFHGSRGYAEIIDVNKMVVPQEKIDAFKKWLVDNGLPEMEPKWLLTVIWG